MEKLAKKFANLSISSEFTSKDLNEIEHFVEEFNNLSLNEIESFPNENIKINIICFVQAVKTLLNKPKCIPKNLIFEFPHYIC